MKYGFTTQRCPKCSGNIYLDKDYYGWYEQCLQCSHIRYLDTFVELKEKAAKVILGKLREAP